MKRGQEGLCLSQSMKNLYCHTRMSLSKHKLQQYAYGDGLE